MDFETHQQAVHWRRHYGRALAGGARLPHQETEKLLLRCRKHSRCETEAYPVCMREFRLRWLGEAVKIMVQRPDWTRCSVITNDLFVPCGHLANFDLTATVKRIRKRLQRSKISGRIVLGGIDLSLNTESNVIKGWQFHLYLIVEGKNESAVQKSIKQTFPSEPSALVPYDFALVTDPLEVVTYAYKALIKRRSGFIGSDGNHRTKDQPLKGADLRELLPFLAKYKVGARLILGGARRNGQRLVFTSRKGSPAARSRS